MARPHKQTVNYFSHDADASEGRTLSILFNNFGHEGISCWWQLLETLSRTNNHVISLNNGEDLEYLAAKLHFTPDRLNEILKKMAELGAIDKPLFEQGLIWSQNFVNRVEQVYKTRRQELPSKPTLLGKETELIKEETQLLKSETPQSKVNKLKETKYISVFNLWNEQGIIAHKTLTSDMKRVIDNTLQDYTQEEIVQAITNYAVIVKGNEYYFNHKWTLVEFLSRQKGNNIERFLDLGIAKQNYLKGGKNGKGGENPRQLRPRDSYSEPDAP